MATYVFCAQIKDSDSGLIVIPDVGCELEIDCEVVGGIPEINITAVWLTGYQGVSACGRVNAVASKSTFIRQIGAAIIDQAEDDDSLRDKVLEEEGIVYVGFGGNDPDGHFRRAS